MAEEQVATPDTDATDFYASDTEAADDSTQGQASDTENVESNETQQSSDEGETLNLVDVSKILGVEENSLDVDTDGGLLFKTNVNGIKGTANLSKLIMNHQIESHLNSKSMEVSELKKTLNTQVEDHKTQATQKMSLLDDLAKVAEHELLSDYEGIDWKNLETEDREEYVFQQAKFKERKDKIVDLLSKIQSEKDKVSDGQKTEATNNAVVEQEKLREAIPEWATDRDKAVAEFGDMSKHASVVGYSDKEFSSISDHRALVVLRESMLYRKLVSEKETITKEVRSAPKFVKSGSSETVDKNTPVENVFYGSG